MDFGRVGTKRSAKLTEFAGREGTWQTDLTTRHDALNRRQSTVVEDFRNELALPNGITYLGFD